MPLRALTAALVISLTGACGDAEPVVLDAAIPLTSAISSECGDPSGLAGMDAVLWIGGHPDCDLDVDQTTFEASGSCGELRTGIDRPLVLVYFMPSPYHVLAYLVGWVDLRREALPTTTDAGIDVVIGAEGTPVILNDTDMMALPEAYSKDAAPEDRAKAYTRERFLDAGVSLDTDADGCTNLEEACNGTLDSVGDTTCP
jgi:hypothetical protein